MCKYCLLMDWTNKDFHVVPLQGLLEKQRKFLFTEFSNFHDREKFSKVFQLWKIEQNDFAKKNNNFLTYRTAIAKILAVKNCPCRFVTCISRKNDEMLKNRNENLFCTGLTSIVVIIVIFASWFSSTFLMMGQRSTFFLRSH